MTSTEITDLMLEDLQKNAASRHNTLGVPGFQTKMIRLGVSSPLIKNIVSEWSRVLFDLSPQRWIEICILLARTGVFEAQILAYEILWENKQVLRKLNAEEVLELGENLDNWVSVDSYCLFIAGWHWREGTLPDSQILSWLKSENVWYRRAAVVCTIPLNLKSKGGTGDAGRTLMICEKALDYREDLVKKAVSWALRELSKINGPAVEDFLEKHYTRIPSLVRREVLAKIETGRKNGQKFILIRLLINAILNVAKALLNNALDVRQLKLTVIL